LSIKYAKFSDSVILGDLKDNVNARKAYKRALQMDPDDFILRLNYAVFEYRRGTLEDCRKILTNLKAPRNFDSNEYSVRI
jgi:Flp pilus assembly protein TadD